ncbi:hypothetical protein E3W66_00420 [Gammaproteobacteria bacterium LSUCC0057]|uniref:Peptidase M48 domain-containing protein n=1 Tax=Gammaproteobacteria bacterium LSUCC0057 TaxID=2559237 RepID=A0A4Y8UJT6_9GAMM|nr:hypothetical protein E3W66_00420 [Gammaproteobacteria bacterium LSUCC0057]
MPVPDWEGNCVTILPNSRPRWLVLLWVVPLWIVLAGHSVADSPSDKFYQQLVANGGRYQDEKLQAYINELGQQLVAVSPMAGEKFTFTVVDSADINAYAMADNYVYINRGLLAFMRNEAQLVSVLAHEVAHITLDHVAGSRGLMLGAQLAAMIAGVLTGSGDVYQAGIAYAESIRSGHGRENELDADSEGAKYMAALGYPPSEMIAMLSIMKDYEQMMKARARDRGVSRPVYHGIFASHPRNDARLRNAVLPAADNLALTARDSARFRLMTEGLIWGDNFVDKVVPAERYSDLNARVRIDFPPGWHHRGSLQSDDLLAMPAAAEDNAGDRSRTESDAADSAATVLLPGQATIALSVQPRTLQSPEEFLYNQLKLSPLQQGSAISPAGLAGYSGIGLDDSGAPYQRIALIYYRYSAYLVVAEVAPALRNSAAFANADKLFMQSINTFRPISQREIDGQKPARLNYVKANERSSIAAISAELGLSDSEQDQLRLINGLYPRGEPEPGQWLKIFRQ